MSRTNSPPMALNSLASWTLLVLSVCLILSLAPCPNLDFCQSADLEDADDLALTPAAPRVLVAVLALEFPKAARCAPSLAFSPPIPRPPIA